VSLLFHLSDLHLREHDLAQGLVIEKLVEALRAEREAAGAAKVWVAITGDLFDSATAVTRLLDSFLQMHDRILGALGADTPMVVVPGNHDRRYLGLVGPHRKNPFDLLARAARGRRIFVGGVRPPFFAQLVPADFHGADAHVVAYDSTYLPHGLLGAGGTIRIEDLLQVYAQLPKDGRPLVVLVHHHLIPTPVTDLSVVEQGGAPRVARWLLGLAPALVSNADREELTMTALGAGTALSALNAFGRPVLLLHGHKHMPTARILLGMTDGCGDLLIASAGTAVRRERVHPTRHPDAARLWPSFNVVHMDAGGVRVDAVSFFPKRSSRPSLRRLLAHVRQVGPKWEVESGTFRVADPEPRVRSDEARYVLSPSPLRTDRWDIDCERTIRLEDGARLRRYVDFVHSLPLLSRRARGLRRGTRRVDLRPNGTTRYAVSQALCRTLAEGARAYGPGAAFEWVGLLCRYGAVKATLRLAAAGLHERPFASFTDLATGRERPLALERAGDDWQAGAEHCAPRSLLRIYWPLESS
jgi:3',5'-cyclic AMP phosphodiesterase CpdA